VDTVILLVLSIKFTDIWTHMQKS